MSSFALQTCHSIFVDLWNAWLDKKQKLTLLLQIKHALWYHKLSYYHLKQTPGWGVIKGKRKKEGFCVDLDLFLYPPSITSGPFSFLPFLFVQTVQAYSFIIYDGYWLCICLCVFIWSALLLSWKFYHVFGKKPPIRSTVSTAWHFLLSKIDCLMLPAQKCNL